MTLTNQPTSGGGEYAEEESSRMMPEGVVVVCVGFPVLSSIDVAGFQEDSSVSPLHALCTFDDDDNSRRLQRSHFHHMSCAYMLAHVAVPDGS
jgi:hypothetical protein